MDNAITVVSRAVRGQFWTLVALLAASLQGLRDYYRVAFLGRQFLPVINVTDTRRQGCESRHSVLCLIFGGTSLQRQGAITEPFGAIARERQHSNERPALEVPWINSKRGPAPLQTTLTPLSTLSLIRALARVSSLSRSFQT